MPYIMYLTFFDVGYFSISINVLELFSSMHLNYLETSIFRTCVYDLLGENRVVLSLGLIISHCWGKTLLCTILSSPWILRFSSLDGENRHYSQLYVIAGYCYLWSFQVVLFLALGSFLTVYTDKYSFECWRKTFCRPLEFSLCVGLSLLELCPANSLCTDLPALPVLSPILRESLGSACVPFHCSVTWKLSSYYAWAIVGLISSVFHLSGITVFCYMMYSVLAIFCSI